MIWMVQRFLSSDLASLPPKEPFKRIWYVSTRKKNICPQVLGNATKEIECHPRRLLIGSLGETCLVSLTEKEYRLVLPFALHTN